MYIGCRKVGHRGLALLEFKQCQTCSPKQRISGPQNLAGNQGKNQVENTSGGGRWCAELHFCLHRLREGRPVPPGRKVFHRVGPGREAVGCRERWREAREKPNVFAVSHILECLELPTETLDEATDRSVWHHCGIMLYVIMSEGFPGKQGCAEIRFRSPSVAF